MSQRASKCRGRIPDPRTKRPGSVQKMRTRKTSSFQTARHRAYLTCLITNPTPKWKASSCSTCQSSLTRPTLKEKSRCKFCRKLNSLDTLLTNCRANFQHTALGHPAKVRKCQTPQTATKARPRYSVKQISLYPRSHLRFPRGSTLSLHLSRTATSCARIR